MFQFDFKAKSFGVDGLRGNASRYSPCSGTFVTQQNAPADYQTAMRFGSLRGYATSVAAALNRSAVSTTALLTAQYEAMVNIASINTSPSSSLAKMC